MLDVSFNQIIGIIERMVQFHKTYKDDAIATPLVTQLSWTNNLLILSGSKSSKERHFYLWLSVKENYSKRELSGLVTFELKLGKFKAEYLGKMNLYSEVLDRDTKKKNENPSVGVICCLTKNIRKQIK